jgi:putative transposase
VDSPFRTVDELALSTPIWVDWFNTTRLHSSIGDIPPIELELDYYRQNTSPATAELGELSLQ